MESTAVYLVNNVRFDAQYAAMQSELYQSLYAKWIIRSQLIRAEGPGRLRGNGRGPSRHTSGPPGVRWLQRSGPAAAARSLGPPPWRRPPSTGKDERWRSSRSTLEREERSNHHHWNCCLCSTQITEVVCDVFAGWVVTLLRELIGNSSAVSSYAD